MFKNQIRRFKVQAYRGLKDSLFFYYYLAGFSSKSKNQSFPRIKRSESQSLRLCFTRDKESEFCRVKDSILAGIQWSGRRGCRNQVIAETKNQAFRAGKVKFARIQCNQA